MRLELDTLKDMDLLMGSDLIYALQKVSWSFLAIFKSFSAKEKKNGLRVTDGWTDRWTNRPTVRQGFLYIEMRSRI